VDTTTTHGASATSRLTAEDVRAALLDKRPSATDQINALVITNDDGIVTLRGHVEDESTHDDLVNRVRAMSAVRGVRDEITVAPRFLQSRNPPASPTYSAGTTTTTGADIGTSSSHD
jgi:osmotically-inducible protein OsmY